MVENEAQGDLLTETSPVETTSWYSEENKDVVERCGWKDPNDAVKSYREIEKMSSGRIKMPTPESSAEEIRAFYQKTGCPENPEGYEITVPEEVATFRDEGIENAMKAIAHEQGVSKQAFEKIVNGYYESIADGLRVGREQGEAALKKELGDKYEAELSIGKRFCQTCSDEFQDLLVQSGLGNNPVFIKEFIAKGKQIMSDTLIQGEVGGDREDGYVPTYKTSPEMYRTGDDEDSVKARAYFTARGHTY